MSVVPAETQLASGLTLILVISLPLMLALLGLLRRPRPIAMALGPWSALPALALALWGTPGQSLELPWLLLGMRLGLDTMGRSFLIFTALLWAMAGVSARYSMVDDPKRHRFFLFYLVTMTGTVGLFLAQDLATFTLFYALMTFAAYGLIIHTENPAAQRAGRIYLILAVVGEAVLLEALLLITAAAGSYEFQGLAGAVAAAPTRDLIILLLLAGYGIKVGVLPLHVWMPLAYAGAPTPASAVLSGMMLMAGFLGWLRLLPLGEVPLLEWGTFCMTVGVVAMFYGVGVGLTQKNPKTILAYSSVNQAGLMTTGIGFSTVVPQVWPLALPALLLYATLHALAMGGLYLGVSVASVATSSVWQRRVVGAGLVIPALALAGALSTSGALAKTLLPATAAMAPWAEWLAWSLSLAAVGITLLMGRFLYHAWPRAQARQTQSRPQLSAGLWLPWVAVLLSVGATPWLLPLSTPLDRVSWSLSPTLLWESLWPIVGGISLAWLVWRVERKSGLLSCLRIPPGDLLVFTDWLTARTQERWCEISPMALLKCTPDLVSQWSRRRGGPWFSSILGEVEGQLGRWMALGLVFLLLVGMFFALFTGAKLP